jgi:hypothetical protein
MYRTVGGVLALLLLALPALRADDPKDKPKTPKEQYEALLKEQNDAMQAFFKAYQEAKTQEEKNKLFQEKYPNPAKMAPKFLELAEKNPKDPVAVDALIWVVNNSYGGGKDSPHSKAIAILRDHVGNEKLGPLCLRLGGSTDKESIDLLREVLEKNKNKDTQGMACLGLGQSLKSEAEAMTDAQAKERDKITKESEEFLVRASEKYGDVKMPYRGTVGERAKGELFELRFLKIGLVAPDIEGVDFDSKKFKLTDYRGKVVLLDFWGNW